MVSVYTSILSSCSLYLLHGHSFIPAVLSFVNTWSLYAISLVQNHKCCPQLCLYKLVVPEREVVVCSADEGQQARNSYPELRIFFLLASHGLLLHGTVGYNIIERAGVRRVWAWPYGQFRFHSALSVWTRRSLPSLVYPRQKLRVQRGTLRFAPVSFSALLSVYRHVRGCRRLFFFFFVTSTATE